MLILTVAINVCACSAEDEDAVDACEFSCWNTYNHCMEKCYEISKEKRSSNDVCYDGCTSWFDGCFVGCGMLDDSF